MLKLIQQKIAQDDVDQLSDYLSDNAGFQKADDFANALEDEYRLLCSQPNIGALRNYLLKNMRMWRISKFPEILIFYLVYENYLEIVRVINGRRNIGVIFTEQEQEQ